MTGVDWRPDSTTRAEPAARREAQHIPENFFTHVAWLDGTVRGKCARSLGAMRGTPVAAQAARMIALALGLLATVALFGRAEAATIAVACDAAALRAAISLANASGEANTLALAADCTYTLAEPHNMREGPNGLPVITGALAIDGHGAVIERSAAAGTPRFRLLFVDVGGHLALRDLTLRNGRMPDGAAAPRGPRPDPRSCIGGPGGPGGGIYNRGTLKLARSTLAGNAAGSGGAASSYLDPDAYVQYGCDGGAGGAGGGLFNLGSAHIVKSTVSGNASGAGGCGGGGDIAAPGADGGAGGGIYNGGILRIAGGTIGDNTTGRGGCGGWWASGDGVGGAGGAGGGVANAGRLTMVNSTVSGNAAGDAGYGGDEGGHGGVGGSGGGIANAGALALWSSTISANAAGGDAWCDCDATPGTPGRGGGVFDHGTAFSFTNTLIALQRRGADCEATRRPVDRFSLDSDGTCGPSKARGAILASKDTLGPLLDYGGPTDTHALLRRSLAWDRGDPAGCRDEEGRPLDTDQRGRPRRQGAGCDIGAFEAQPGEHHPRLTRLQPLEVWISLGDGDDSGLTLDLRAEVYRNGTLIAEGTRIGVSGGAGGFAGRRAEAIPLRLLDGPTVLLDHNALSIRLLSGNGCSGPSASRAAVLWYDGPRAGTSFGVTVDNAERRYHLHAGLGMDGAPGAGPEQALAMRADHCGPQQIVGTWTVHP